MNKKVYDALNSAENENKKSFSDATKNVGNKIKDTAKSLKAFATSHLGEKVATLGLASAILLGGAGCSKNPSNTESSNQPSQGTYTSESVSSENSYSNNESSTSTVTSDNTSSTVSNDTSSTVSNDTSSTVSNDTSSTVSDDTSSAPVNPGNEVTPADVENAYHDMAYPYMYNYFLSANPSFSSDGGKTLDESFSIRFDSIKPGDYMVDGDTPFYCEDEGENGVVGVVGQFGEEPTYVELNVPVYTVNLGYAFTIFDAELNHVLSNLSVPAPEFEKLMSAFNVNKFTFTQEMCDEAIKDSDDKFYKRYLNRFVGQEVYENKGISAEDIKNASPEQLKVLYDVYDVIDKINFKGELPEQYMADEMTY